MKLEIVIEQATIDRLNSYQVNVCKKNSLVAVTTFKIFNLELNKLKFFC